MPDPYGDYLPHERERMLRSLRRAKLEARRPTRREGLSKRAALTLLSVEAVALFVWAAFHG